MRLTTIVHQTPPTRRRALVAGALALATAGLALAVTLAPAPAAAEAAAGSPSAPAPEQLAPVPAAVTAPAPDSMDSPLPEGKVTSPYGRRTRPVAPGIGVPELHRGIDLAAPAGTPVRAPTAGVVRQAAERSPEGQAWGTVVVVEHDDGFQSFFAHLGSFAVREGERVEKGQTVGTVGSTGVSTGPHLHWELRGPDGETVDPSRYAGGC